MSDTRWMERGECQYRDPEAFFPIGTTGPAVAQAEHAKAICRTCPVISDCLSWALVHLEFGVAGGMDEDERRKLKRRKARAAERVPAANARRMIALAKERGITYTAMSEATGMPRASLAYVANGKHPNVTKATEDAIAGGLGKLLGVSV